MMKFVLAITLAAVFGLLIATHRNDTSLHASAAVTPAAQMATETPADDEQCDGTTMSEDAASCSAGGWTATLTCCNTSPGPLERWSKGTSHKCCGPCFLP